MLKNLKVSQKLIIILIINAIFLCIVGFVGMYENDRLFNNGQSIYDKGLIPITKLTNLRSNFIDIRSNMEGIINPNRRNDMDKHKQAISDFVTMDNALMKDFEEMYNINDTERSLYEKSVKSNLDEYRNVRDKVMMLCNQGKYEEAQLIYDKEYAKITSVIETGIEGTINEGVVLAKAHTDDNATSKRMAMIVLSITIALGFLLSGLFNFIVSKGIINKINSVVDFTKKIGNKDLSQKIETKTNDELDAMSNALNKAVDNIRDLILEITSSTHEMSASSEELTATIEEVSATMITIKQSTQEIAQGNEELSASTEEVSTSTEEIECLTNELSNKSEEGEKASTEIKERATTIKNKAIESSDTTHRIYEEKKLIFKKQ